MHWPYDIFSSWTGLKYAGFNWPHKCQIIFSSIYWGRKGWQSADFLKVLPLLTPGRRRYARLTKAKTLIESSPELSFYCPVIKVLKTNVSDTESRIDEST